MATLFNPTYPISRQPASSVPATAPALAVPANTFAPGTKVQVGGHRVVIEKYLSEGGFAHVYLVQLPSPVNGDDKAVLKRVAVPDREALANMRTEVETMKQLKGQRHIVTYIDSHASQLKGGGYEVFLLMEYCNGGGLIDYMNTRLQNRLTEPEVLKIFLDAALGVACMHYLKQPLLHRDLKVENILITSSGSSRKYKLCDFGSAAPPRPAATSAAEGRLIEDDISKHTTLQYRSPEMIDVYRKHPIDEKSDIWALGVLLYKLCYYKTPFEKEGPTAILNVKFDFPGYPSFSDSIKKLIAGMLGENPQARPNIYQVVRDVCLLRGCDVPIRDIYAGRTQSESRRNQQLPPTDPQAVTLLRVGASKVPPVEEKMVIPEIVPMRRGRPTKIDKDARLPKPSPSPLRAANGDPFLALDSHQPTLAQQPSQDEISARFPTIDDFSLFHDSGGKFPFDSHSEAKTKPLKDINQRVTDALADEAFARPLSSSKSESERQPTAAKASPSFTSTIETQDSAKSQMPNSRSQEEKRPVKMVSTGTMTSPISTSLSELPSSKSQTRPILRFPSPNQRSSSQPRSSEAAATSYSRPSLLDFRSKSQIGTLSRSRSPTSSTLDIRDPPTTDLSRSKSATEKTRPSSLQLEPKRSLRNRVHSREALPKCEASQGLLEAEGLSNAVASVSDTEQEATKIDSNVDFLRAMEEEDPSKKREKRLSSGSKHVKRASMPSISLSGTKNLLAGRFGEAFRRFETNTSDPGPPSPGLSPDRDGTFLTPIAGSEATDGRSDDGYVYEETEVPPEVRRELERRRLSQEEKRVAEAGAAYKQRLAEGGSYGKRPGGSQINSRAASIQSKVKTLLDESGRASPSPTKKPQGYGRFTGSPDLQRPPQPPRKMVSAASPPFPVPLRTNSLPKNQSRSEAALSNKGPLPRPAQTAPITITTPAPRPIQTAPVTNINLVATASSPTLSRPSAPHKPQALRINNQSPLSRVPASQPQSTKPSTPVGNNTNKPFAQPPPMHQQQRQNRNSNPYLSHLRQEASEGDSVVEEDWEANFSKRYPTLAGLEMVETEIQGRQGEKVGDT
ncbi:MAG: hypothetical protein LQ351_006444 [Letrouitia transgressa]|nr:MAG: hypothetical protein LQ351_006444 [Letrouitia transgressa]